MQAIVFLLVLLCSTVANAGLVIFSSNQILNAGGTTFNNVRPGLNVTVTLQSVNLASDHVFSIAPMTIPTAVPAFNVHPSIPLASQVGYQITDPLPFSGSIANTGATIRFEFSSPVTGTILYGANTTSDRQIYTIGGAGATFTSTPTFFGSQLLTPQSFLMTGVASTMSLGNNEIQVANAQSITWELNRYAAFPTSTAGISFDITSFTPAIPEPSSMLLVGMVALCGLLHRERRSD